VSRSADFDRGKVDLKDAGRTVAPRSWSLRFVREPGGLDSGVHLRVDTGSIKIAPTQTGWTDM